MVVCDIVSEDLGDAVGVLNSLDSGKPCISLMLVFVIVAWNP